MRVFGLVLLGAWLASSVVSAQSGLIGHWNFNQPTGSVAPDSVGGNNGTLTAGAAFVGGGIQGNAIDLTGGQVNLPVGVLNAIEANPSNSFAYSMWIRPEAFGSYKTVFDTTGRQSSLWINSASDGFYQTSLGGGGNAYVPNWTLNQWQHLVYQFDNTTDTLSVYRDGVLNWSIITGAGDPLFDQALVIGGNPSGGGTAWDGQIDDLQIYNRALTPTQINFLRDNPGANLNLPEPLSLTAWAIAGVGLFVVARRSRRK